MIHLPTTYPQPIGNFPNCFLPKIEPTIDDGKSRSERSFPSKEVAQTETLFFFSFVEGKSIRLRAPVSLRSNFNQSTSSHSIIPFKVKL